MLKRTVTLLGVLALLVALATPTAAIAAPDRGDDGDHGASGGHGRHTLEAYARDTWRSFVHMTHPRTGLPADNIGGDLRTRTRAAYTSPTNVGMYLWATLAARDLGLVRGRDAVERIDKALDSLEQLERHEPSGQFYNWYDPASLDKLTVWPVDGSTVHPFLSSVDNGWLASALLMVADAVPQLDDRASDLAASMNFGCYYDPAAKGAPPGLIRGGFWVVGDEPPGSEGFPSDDYCGMGETVVYTGHHYGAFNTEPRIASYIGIAQGQIPPEHYYAGWRTFPDTCDWSWPEAKPVGEWRTYGGVEVFEGAYRYDDQLVVPTWGGSMFEALMPALVVPEEEWGPDSWAVTHPLYVEAQREFGLEEAGYGYWGFSPASDPAGGYREYGVDAIGMEPNGYTADVQRQTLVDTGWDDQACPRPATPTTEYGEGVVTPHAAFLALDFERGAALDNLARLRADFPGLYGRGGFKDTVNVATGRVADRYLALDQGMVIAAIANELLDDRLQGYLADTLQPELEPLMAVEEFGAGRVQP
ncbi:MAG: glucoamylase family protein [Acidimicrobiales bacterium]